MNDGDYVQGNGGIGIQLVQDMSDFVLYNDFGKVWDQYIFQLQWCVKYDGEVLVYQVVVIVFCIFWCIVECELKQFGWF